MNIEHWFEFKYRILALSVLLALTLYYALFLPNSIYGKSFHANTISVKANMYTMQTMVETYAVDWEGLYPTSISILRQEAQNSKKQYWKEMTNPYMASHQVKTANLDMGHKPLPGVVVYSAIPDTRTGKITAYRIYGYDEKAKAIEVKGKVLTLSEL